MAIQNPAFDMYGTELQGAYYKVRELVLNKDTITIAVDVYASEAARKLGVEPLRTDRSNVYPVASFVFLGQEDPIARAYELLKRGQFFRAAVVDV